MQTVLRKKGRKHVCKSPSGYRPDRIRLAESEKAPDRQISSRHISDRQIPDRTTPGHPGLIVIDRIENPSREKNRKKIDFFELPLANFYKGRYYVLKLAKANPRKRWNCTKCGGEQHTVCRRMQCTVSDPSLKMCHQRAILQ